MTPGDSGLLASCQIRYQRPLGRKLSSCGKRPDSRAADKPHGLASSHAAHRSFCWQCIGPSSTLGRAEPVEGVYLGGADLRCGSKPEVPTPTRHFRSTPDSRHRYADRSGPFRANFGSGRLHSITSSARSRNASGILNPSALAAFRLMMRSNFTGCCTGMSAGFAPRRILSTNSAARLNRSGKFAP
jgi:hypothetical protein